jgi:hypothetical protein
MSRDWSDLRQVEPPGRASLKNVVAVLIIDGCPVASAGHVELEVRPRDLRGSVIPIQFAIAARTDEGRATLVLLNVEFIGCQIMISFGLTDERFGLDPLPDATGDVDIGVAGVALHDYRTFTSLVVIFGYIPSRSLLTPTERASRLECACSLKRLRARLETLECLSD